MAHQAALIPWGLIHQVGLYSSGKATASGIEVRSVGLVPCFPQGSSDQLSNVEFGVAGMY